MKKVIIYSIRTAAALILILNSCKKAEITRPQITDEELIAKSRANAAMQMAKEGGIPQIFTTKQKVKTQWVDQFGKPVNKEQMQQENFTSACNYSTPASCNLIQYSRVFQCAGSSLGGPGYLLQFEYEISWNSNIVYTGTGGAQTTGSISIISDATSNQVYTASLTAANSEVYITEIGQDPNNSGYYIFRVKFLTVDFTNDLVPSGYINGDAGGTYTVKVSATFVTDCKTGGAPYALWLLPVIAYGFTGDSGNDPCKRNEKGWVNPAGSGGTGTNVLTVTGYNSTGLTTCGYGTTFIVPDLQQVEYNVDGGTWSSMSNSTASGLPISGQPYIRAADVAVTPALPPGNHLIGIRYRNWKYIATNPSGWPIPSFTNDCFSPGDNPANNTSSTTSSTFAYEFWACVIP